MCAGRGSACATGVAFLIAVLALLASANGFRGRASGEICGSVCSLRLARCDVGHDDTGDPRHVAYYC